MNVDYRNKHIVVLGCGSSGEAAAGLLRKEGAMVTVLDTARREDLGARPAQIEALGANVVTGLEALDDERLYDLAVLSPGIPRASPLVQRILDRRIDMIGELELAYEMCPCPVVAITGTNGKTTTTGLIASMLRGAGFRVVAGGNMGPPFSDLIGEAQTCDYAVIEASSFQLEEIRTFRPRVAVWLNFAADHLDRYTSLEEYRAAKLRIFMNQGTDDWAVVNGADPLTGLSAQTVTFSALRDGCQWGLSDGTTITREGRPVLDMRETNLRGAHNAENLMAALAVGVALDCETAELLPGLCAYRPDAHRCEVVAEAGGVLYINDSKATNPSALEMALRSQSRPVVLIAGGKRKGFTYDTLRPLVAERVKAAVLIGQVADEMARAWAEATPCHTATTLDEAVAMAAALASSGDAVLLSPGTSSFDMFRSYEDRGQQFARAVGQHLTQHTHIRP